MSKSVRRHRCAAKTSCSVYKRLELMLIYKQRFSRKKACISCFSQKVNKWGSLALDYDYWWAKKVFLPVEIQFFRRISSMPHCPHNTAISCVPHYRRLNVTALENSEFRQVNPGHLLTHLGLQTYAFANCWPKGTKEASSAEGQGSGCACGHGCKFSWKPDLDVF